MTPAWRRARKPARPLAQVDADAAHRERRRLAALQAQLVEPGAGAHQHREGLRRDLQVERPGVAVGDVVERRAMVGQRAHEDVDPAGGALRVGAGRDAGRQRQPLGDLGDVDAAALQHRAARSGRARAWPRRRCARRPCGRAPGRNEARTRQARSPSRRSRLAGCTWSDANGSAGGDGAPRDQRLDRLAGQDAGWGGHGRRDTRGRGPKSGKRRLTPSERGDASHRRRP